MRMRMAFPVGETERHEVVFTFDQFWGGLTISVDGETVVRTVRVLSFSTLAQWDLDVGQAERHHVRIEKRRLVLFAGARPQTVTAFVDGVQVTEQRTGI